MSERTLAKSFASGELSAELFGRMDLSKFQSGLALCRNFIVLPHGPVANRPGTSFVREVKDSTKAVRLIPFTYSSTQTMVIEVGAGYFRFHTGGGTLMNGAVPYEIANPYAEADLFDIHYTQSADVLTLVHPLYAVRELRRIGALNWQLIAPSFSAPTNAPASCTAAATVGTGTTNYQYCATTVNPNNFEESVASPVSGVITNNLTVAGNYNTVSWGAVAGAVRYNVYKLQNGLYGYIGQAGALTFIDNNIVPDMSKTPPMNEAGFNDAAGNYPAAVSYFEQRRCFAGTVNKPQNMWMTRSGTESNMSYTIPVRDDNRVAFRIAAREASAIRHIVPVSNMVLLTPSCEWRVASSTNEAITPATISVRPQSYIGASNVQPVVVGNSILFGQDRGGRIREMSYNWQAAGYQTSDITIVAPHLFDYTNVTDLSYSRSPYPILWAISSTGKLLGMTYVPEQEVAAWHQHDTDGVFESVTTVAESGEDAVYFVVKRTINGAQKRYIERLHSRYFATQADAFFVDCGVSYSGAPISNVTGLTWLEGKTVNILADGAVMPKQVVTGGAIGLEQPASKIHVGLPITADIQTLPLGLQIDNGFGQGKTKNVNKAWLRVHRSSGIFAGPSFDRLTEVKQRTIENYGSPPALKTEEVSVSVAPSWGADGAVCIRQLDPLPLNILSIALEVAIGG